MSLKRSYTHVLNLSKSSWEAVKKVGQPADVLYTLSLSTPKTQRGLLNYHKRHEEIRETGKEEEEDEMSHLTLKSFSLASIQYNLPPLSQLPLWLFWTKVFILQSHTPVIICRRSTGEMLSTSDLRQILRSIKGKKDKGGPTKSNGIGDE